MPFRGACPLRTPWKVCGYWASNGCRHLSWVDFCNFGLCVAWTSEIRNPLFWKCSWSCPVLLPSWLGFQPHSSFDSTAASWASYCFPELSGTCLARAFAQMCLWKAHSQLCRSLGATLVINPPPLDLLHTLVALFSLPALHHLPCRWIEMHIGLLPVSLLPQPAIGMYIPWSENLIPPDPAAEVWFCSHGSCCSLKCSSAM